MPPAISAPTAPTACRDGGRRPLSSSVRVRADHGCRRRVDQRSSAMPARQVRPNGPVPPAHALGRWNRDEQRRQGVAMFQKLIVPVDGSVASFTAVPVAALMARAVGGTIEVITVVDRLADVALARDALDRDLADVSDVDATVERHVL